MKNDFTDQAIEQIRVATKDSGYKTAFLAAKIGVHPSTMSRFLNRSTRLGIPALILLVQTLKLNLDDLLEMPYYDSHDRRRCE